MTSKQPIKVELTKMLKRDQQQKKANDQEYINSLSRSLIALDKAIFLAGNANRGYEDLTKAKTLIEAQLGAMGKTAGEIFAKDAVQPLSIDDVITLMQEQGLNLDTVIDACIKANGIIGVGLVTFRENVSAHIRSHHK
jgi:hypothetical protein